MSLVAINTTEADRLLVELERAVDRARLALHAVERYSQNLIPCGDTDGDGDCPRCVSQQYRRPSPTCEREAAGLRVDAEQAFLEAVEDADDYAKDLRQQTGVVLKPALYGGGWDGNG